MNYKVIAMDKVFKDLHDALEIKLKSPEDQQIMKNAKNMLIPIKKSFKVLYNNKEKNILLIRNAVGPLLLQNKTIWFYQFFANDQWKVYNVLIRADEFDEQELMPLFSSNEIMVRIDSGCLTGQLFFDETCDCRDQLYAAIIELLQNKEGLIIHIPQQDGRGKGLSFKLSTLYLQQKLNLNTIEAAALLANDKSIDDRTYYTIIGILKFFKINTDYKIELNTNNPEKTLIFKENGYKLTIKRSIVKVNDITKTHLLAKKKYLKHKI